MADTSDARHPVEALAEEFLERCRRGERPAVSEYTRRYPDLAEQIRGLFPALQVLEEARSDDDDSRKAAGSANAGTPQRLGDFRIIREVGRGGMGVVYEAEQVSLGRRVALKVLPRQVLLDSRHAKRFEREARAAAKLHHTNIVPVFGVGQQDGLHYYVMQFIHGLGLDEVLVELKRQRVEGQGSRVKGPAAAVGVQASACVGQPEGWTPIRNDVSAAGVAQSLLSGQFDRTLLVNSEEETGTISQESGGSDQQTRPDKSKIQNRKSKIPTHTDTVVGQLSDTLPGHSNQTRTVYRQSVARIGVQAAEALHYAHDQGVIHRDVKPGNLLLDTRGCVWVTDFGLAKATDQQDLTHTGDVLGTLRYMAPEQFDGKADHRSDVYSLGLTMYELLSLNAAFDETERHKLVKQVTTLTPARLRVLDRSIPRDLETIVHKAIERDPAHRYQTAGELAADLQRYLGDEPIHARRPPALQRLAKWGRRHRAVVVTAGTGLLVAIGLLGGSAGWVARDRAAQRAMAEAEVIRAMNDAEDWIAKGDLRQANAATQRAEGVLSGGLVRPDVAASVRDLLTDLRLADRVEEIRLAMCEIGPEVNRFAEVEQLPQYEEMFLDLGVRPLQTSPAEAAAMLKRRSGIARVALISALDTWSRVARIAHRDDQMRWLVDVACRLDGDPWRNQFRCALRDNEIETLRTMVVPIDVADHSPAVLYNFAASLSQHGDRESARRLLLDCQRQYPADFWTNHELCVLCGDIAQSDDSQSNDAERGIWSSPHSAGLRGNSNYWEEAVQFGRVAVALRPDRAAVRVNFGAALMGSGRLDAAVREFRQAAALDPDFTAAYTNLSAALSLAGRPDEAIRAGQRAAELAPDSCLVQVNLGCILWASGRLGEARVATEAAIRLNPRDAVAHYNLGNILRDQNRPAEAVVEYRAAIELNYAQAHVDLGNVLAKLGHLDEAIAEYRAAIGLDSNCLPAHANLGRLLAAQGLVDEAIEAFRAAVNVASGDTDQRQVARRDLALSLFDRAKDLSHTAIVEDRDPERALQMAQEAVDLDPENGMYWTGLGHALYRAGRFNEAHDAMQKGFGLGRPGHQAALCHALILWELGQRDAALTRYNAARQSLDPKLASGTASEIVLTLLAEFDAKRSQTSELVTQPNKSDNGR